MTGEAQLLLAQLAALLEDEPECTANLANTSALLMSQLADLNWVGFYLVAPTREGSHNELVLGPFQGLPACLRLPFGKGVCGTAWQNNRSVRVDDVHAFPGHIACDSASQSELVVPLRRPDGTVFGVLDLDSPMVGRFGPADQELIEQVCGFVESHSSMILRST